MARETADREAITNPHEDFSVITNMTEEQLVPLISVFKAKLEQIADDPKGYDGYTQIFLGSALRLINSDQFNLKALKALPIKVQSIFLKAIGK
jgi:hypothetical protein